MNSIELAAFLLALKFAGAFLGIDFDIDMKTLIDIMSALNLADLVLPPTFSTLNMWAELTALIGPNVV